MKIKTKLKSTDSRMSFSNTVVQGEALESDSEDDKNSAAGQKVNEL